MVIANKINHWKLFKKEYSKTVFKKWIQNPKTESKNCVGKICKMRTACSSDSTVYQKMELEARINWLWQALSTLNWWPLWQNLRQPLQRESSWRGWRFGGFLRGHSVDFTHRVSATEKQLGSVISRHVHSSFGSPFIATGFIFVKVNCQTGLRFPVEL